MTEEANDDTQPGLTQAEDGTISIGPAASKASRERAWKESFEHAQKTVIDPLNAETEKAGNAEPGAPADDQKIGTE